MSKSLDYSEFKKIFVDVGMTACKRHFKHGKAGVLSFIYKVYIYIRQNCMELRMLH